MDINISYKRDMNHSYILFSGGTIETENYQVQMVLHRLLPGLLPCCVYSLDNQQVWCCENTSTQKLSVYCQIHALGMAELTWIYGSLLKNLQELQEYLIDLNTIYLTPDELYVDPFQNQVQCCLVPFYEKDIWENLLQLSQYLLGFLNQQDSDAVALAYGIFRYLSQGGSSLEALWTMLYGSHVHDSSKRQGGFEESENWFQSSAVVRQSRGSGELTAAERQNRNLKELNALERDKIEEINLEMERRRQRDLDEIFKEEEDYTKKKWQLPSWLRRWKREKQEETMEDILFRDDDRVDFSRENDLMRKNWKKRKNVRKAVEEKVGARNIVEEKVGEWEEKSSVLPPCDERRAEYEETEAATTLLTAVRAGAQAVLIHDFSKERFVLEQPIVVIGKMPGAAQLILKEATVSRIHARIVHREDGYYLEDMNSKNGTYVNGELLESQKQVKLKAEDKICFADVAYTYLE